LLPQVSGASRATRKEFGLSDSALTIVVRFDHMPPNAVTTSFRDVF
jgi:hypothetical protein